MSMEVAFLYGNPAEHRKKFQEGRVPHVTRQSVPSGINHDPGTGFRARMPHRAEPGSCTKTAQAPEASGRAGPECGSRTEPHGLISPGNACSFGNPHPVFLRPLSTVFVHDLLRASRRVPLPR